MAKPSGQNENRAQLYGETLPEIPASERLPDLWLQLGYAKHGGFGPVPLDWGEVRSFVEMTACDLSPVEARCLVEMSRAYVQALSDDNPLSIAPMERA